MTSQLRKRAEEIAKEKAECGEDQIGHCTVCTKTFERDVEELMAFGKAFAERALRELMSHPCVVWSGQPSEDFIAEAIKAAE